MTDQDPRHAARPPRAPDAREPAPAAPPESRSAAPGTQPPVAPARAQATPDPAPRREPPGTDALREMKPDVARREAANQASRNLGGVREAPPAMLRAAVHADLRPVRPLPSPWRRALVLLPFVLLVVAAPPIVYGLRGDADVLGVVDVWGLSAAQALLGFVLIAVALRESVPGRAVPRARALLAMGVLASIVVTFVTFSRSATYAPPRFVGLFWTICFSRPLLIGLPLVGIALIAAWRAYPLRAALVGALVGLGAGLVTDAGWRTFCHVSDPWHVFSAHLAAMLALCGTGAAAAALLSHHRR